MRGGSLHRLEPLSRLFKYLWALVPHLLMLEARQYMSTLLIIILVLFLLGGGGWGYSRWRG